MPTSSARSASEQWTRIAIEIAPAILLVSHAIRRTRTSNLTDADLEQLRGEGFDGLVSLLREVITVTLVGRSSAISPRLCGIPHHDEYAHKCHQ